MEAKIKEYRLVGNYKPVSWEVRQRAETGRGLGDWIKLSEDFNKLSDLELAIGKIKHENEGLQLTDQNALLLLSDQLGFDIDTIDELETTERLKLSIFANKHKKYLQDQQDQYRKPLENHTKDNESTQSSDEKIFVGGREVDYKEYQKQRKSYLENREKAVSAIDKDAFTIEIDGKQGKTALNFDYVFSDQDKQSMLSITESVDTIIPRFVDQNGELDHTAFNKAMWWAIPENRDKAIKSIVIQARSNGIDEVLKKERNIDFNTKPLPNQDAQNQSGYGQVGTSNTNDGISVQYKFNG